MFPTRPSEWDPMGALKNLFGLTPKNQQQITIGGTPQLQSTIPNYPYAGYQVQGGDTFDTIAETNGLTTQQLQQANSGMLVPPPAGRMINIPVQPKTAGPYYQSEKFGEQPTSQIAQTNQMGYPSYNRVSFPQFTQATAQDNDIALGQVMTTLQSGQLPQSISLYAFNNLVNQSTGTKYTHQDMIENGYTFNPVTGSYMLGSGVTGSPTAPATGLNGQPLTAAQGGNTAYSQTGFAQQYAANNTPLLQQKRWDPKKKKYVKIGDLIRQGRLDTKTGRMYNQPMKRNKKGKLVPMEKNEAPTYTPPPEATNAGGTPSQQLNANQAGG